MIENLKSNLTGHVPSLATWRKYAARRAAHRDLQRSLAVYTSYADRLELAAILERADPQDAAEVRAVLQEMGIAA